MNTSNNTLRLLFATFAIACTVACAFAQTSADIDRLRMHADAGRDERALRTLLQSANSGNIDAQRATGEALLNHPDPSRRNEALQWLERVATQDDLRAMFALGKAYFAGDTTRRPDYPTAHRWLSHAHRKGSPHAAYYLGLMHKSGYGVSINMSIAMKHFQFAADQNIAEAMYELGNAHADSVDEDRREAMRWYLRAAALEYAPAIQEIANAYARGDSMLPQSDLQASMMLKAIEHALKHRKAAP